MPSDTIYSSVLLFFGELCGLPSSSSLQLFSGWALDIFRSSCNDARVRVQSINPVLISAFHLHTPSSPHHGGWESSARCSLRRKHRQFDDACASNAPPPPPLPVATTAEFFFCVCGERWRKNESTQVKVLPCSYCMRWFLSKMTVWNTWPTKMNSWPVPSDSSK